METSNLNLPDRVVEIRRSLCESKKCSHPDIDFTDPCVECPNGSWGIYDSIACRDAKPRVISNAISAAGRLARATFTGSKIRVDETEQKRRLSICESCEFYTGKKCTKCGCFIAFKTRLATEHCPINKW